MSEGKFYPIEYYLAKTAVHSKILEKNPQCADCEHMQFLTFSPESYKNLTLKKYCSSCPKFEEVEDNGDT